LREVVPGLQRLAIMANVDLPTAEMEMGGVQTAARTLGLEVVPAEIRRAEDIAPAFEGLKSRLHGSLSFSVTHRIRWSISSWSSSTRLSSRMLATVTSLITSRMSLSLRRRIAAPSLSSVMVAYERVSAYCVLAVCSCSLQ